MRKPAAVDDGVARFKYQLPAAGHGVARVDGEIHDHLLDLPGIRNHRAKFGVQPVDEFYIFAGQPAKHVADALDRGVQVDRPVPHHLFAAEGEQLSGEGSGTLSGLLNLLGVVALLVVALRIVEQQVAVAGNHREQVVEIVRHSAGEPPDRFHLLRLAQLLLAFIERFFGQLTLGKIAADQDAAADLAAVIP